MPGQWRQRLIGFQAGYYCLTGVWPLLHMASFEAVTGPKVDDWLVKMVGSTSWSWRQEPPWPLRGSTSGGLNGRISRIYLPDATLGWRSSQDW
jgi:hypothetical protein